MGSYRKKPIVVEAQQVTYDNAEAIADWCDGVVRGTSAGRPVIAIDTLEGTMRADEGDWVIQEPSPTPDRRFYPCKPNIFEATYEPVVESPGAAAHK